MFHKFARKVRLYLAPKFALQRLTFWIEILKKYAEDRESSIDKRLLAVREMKRWQKRCWFSNQVFIDVALYEWGYNVPHILRAVNNLKKVRRRRKSGERKTSFRHQRISILILRILAKNSEIY